MTTDIHEVQLDAVRFARAGQIFAFDLRMHAPFTAIAGSSGSGKTTLLHLIAGFEQANGGRILIDKRDVTGLHPSERPVSLVFQENNLFAHLDIFTNVALGVSPSLSLQKDDRDRVSEALSRTGLAGYEKRLPASLSGGERQRAAFARALVRNQPLLLLDEPFAALDPALRIDMGLLLKELQKETGIMVIMVTHMPEEVSRLADQLVFLAHGRAVYTGPADAIVDPNGPPELKAFAGQMSP